MSETNGDTANPPESDEEDLGITYHYDDFDFLEYLVCLFAKFSKNNLNLMRRFTFCFAE